MRSAGDPCPACRLGFLRGCPRWSSGGPWGRRGGRGRLAGRRERSELASRAARSAGWGVAEWVHGHKSNVFVAAHGDRWSTDSAAWIGMVEMTRPAFSEAGRGSSRYKAEAFKPLVSLAYFEMFADRPARWCRPSISSLTEVGTLPSQSQPRKSSHIRFEGR